MTNIEIKARCEDVERAERVKVRTQDENGDPFELEAEGFLAVGTPP